MWTETAYETVKYLLALKVSNAFTIFDFPWVFLYLGETHERN